MSEEHTAKYHADQRPTRRKSSGEFVRTRWFHALAQAEQMRRNTEASKVEQLKKYAFKLPQADLKPKLWANSIESQTKHVDSSHQDILNAAVDTFTLDDLAEKFLELKQIFNEILEIRSHDGEQLMLSTAIARTALLIVFRSTELIVHYISKGTRRFPSLNSLISFVRSRQCDLPIHGRLLLEWYAAAQALDILANDADWLVHPRKAHWAIGICHDTLTWARAIAHQNFTSRSLAKAILDRDESPEFMRNDTKE